MRHQSIRELFEYWNQRRGIRPAPDRADIDPAAIRSVLGDTFILCFDESAGYPFRIAGTRVCAAFGRELKSESFLDLWAVGSRRQVRDLLNVVGHEVIGAVASACGTSSVKSRHDVELLLLPLAHRGRNDARMMGAIAPRDGADWLGTRTLAPLSLGTPRYLGAGLDPAPSIAPASTPPRPEGRIRHGFTVYDGGLT